MKLEKTEKILYYICLGVISGLILWRLIANIIYQLPEFDGAMNYQVAVNLVREGTYSTRYNGGTVFDEVVQSNGPFEFLIALSFNIFGIGTPQALLVNAVFVVLMFVGFYKINRFLKVNPYLILIFFAIITVTPYFWDFATGGYGEIPTLALFLWSIYVLMKSDGSYKLYFFLMSGVLYALAYLTKTVILIALPAIAFTLLIKLCKKEVRFKQIALWILGFLLPIVLYEIYRFVQLDGFSGYVEFWMNQIPDIMQQAGVSEGFADTPNIMDKFILHLQTFSSLFSINEWVTLVILIVTGICWLIKKIKTKKFEYYDILIMVAYCYFGWWLLITPTEKAWNRRILLGVLLMENSVFFLLNDTLAFLKQRFYNQRKKSIVYLIICLGCLSSFYVRFGKDISCINSSSKLIANEAADLIKDIEESNPDARFYGVGWWQAPLLSFLADVTFYDLDDGLVLTGNKHYLVIDNYTYSAKEYLVANLTVEEVYSNVDNGYDVVIYEIINP